MYHPVTIPKNAFAFCRYSLAVIIWAAFIFKNQWLVLFSLIVFLLSAILTVKKSPMVWLYTQTIEKIIPSPPVMLDINAMRFAHLVASAFSGLILFCLFLPDPKLGWRLLFIFALLKTITALGFCPAGRLYQCLNTGGGCCRFTAKVKSSKRL